MNRKIIIYFLLVFIVGIVLKFELVKLSESFESSSNKKKKSILVTGTRSQVIAQSIKKQVGEQYNLFVHISPEESKLFDLNYIVGSIDNKNVAYTAKSIADFGPFDIIIHNLHDPRLVSGSILNINNNLNIKNQIIFLKNILIYAKPYGKIVSFLTNLEEFSGQKVLDWNMGYFIKSQSLESYKDLIALATIKFPELSNGNVEFPSVLDFILKSQWNEITGREFYSTHIHNKTPGYMFELANLEANNLSSSFGSFKNPHTNYYIKLKTKIATDNNLLLENICFFQNTQIFLSNVINKFVPTKPLIGFSDDDPKNVEVMRKAFKDKPDNLVKTYSTAGGIKKEVQ